MATTKKKAKRKTSAPKKLAVANLRAITLASVKAAIGKQPGGGIINGFVLDETALEKLGVSANALAKSVTSATAKATGLKLTPVVIKKPGSITVGFLPPTKILL